MDRRRFVKSSAAACGALPVFPFASFVAVNAVNENLPSRLVTLIRQNNTISLGPGIGLHKNIALCGALPTMDAPTVYLTGFTPFRHFIRFS